MDGNRNGAEENGRIDGDRKLFRAVRNVVDCRDSKKSREGFEKTEREGHTGDATTSFVIGLLIMAIAT